MKKEELMKYYESLMCGYSAFDVETEKPYSLPLEKVTYGRLGSAKEAYDIKRDRHIAPAFKPIFLGMEVKQRNLHIIALCIVSNLCKLSLGIPDSRQMCELISLSAYSPEELDCHADRLSSEIKSCVRVQKLQPVAVILFVSLFDFLCEDAKVLSQDQKKKRDSYSREKTAKKFYDGRLRQIVDFLYKNGLLSFFTLEDYSVQSMISLIHGSPESTQDTDLLVKAVALYEDAVKRYGEIHCHRRIINNEMVELKRLLTQEEDRFILESQRQTEKKLREETRSIAKKRNPLENAVLAQPPDSFQLPAYSPFNHTALLNPAGNVFQNTIVKAYNAVDKKIKQLTNYEEAVYEKAQSYLAEAVEQEARYLSEDFATEIVESAFLAILNGDEICNTVIGSYVFQLLGQSSCIPTLPVFTPELEDEDNWDDLEFPGDNRELEDIVLGETDVGIYHSEKSGDDLVTIKYGAAVAEYADSQVLLPIAIRKSQVKAFRKMGCSGRKARDYALIAATLRSVNWQDPTRTDVSNFFTDISSAAVAIPPEPTLQNPSGESDSLRKSIEEEQRKRKAAERESQMLRHEIAKLRRELEKTEAKLERSDALLELYESRDEEPQEESEPAESPQFPFATNRKIVLFGGFHSFHQEILKLIPGLRIIPCTSRIDVAPIRNADFVFIQINNTSHSNYWTVCDAAKAAAVPYYHLNYASPKRCAEEIVQKILDMDSPA